MPGLGGANVGRRGSHAPRRGRRTGRGTVPGPAPSEIPPGRRACPAGPGLRRGPRRGPASVAPGPVWLVVVGHWQPTRRRPGAPHADPPRRPLAVPAKRRPADPSRLARGGRSRRRRRGTSNRADHAGLVAIAGAASRAARRATPMAAGPFGRVAARCRSALGGAARPGARPPVWPRGSCLRGPPTTRSTTTPRTARARGRSTTPLERAGRSASGLVLPAPPAVGPLHRGCCRGDGVRPLGARGRRRARGGRRRCWASARRSCSGSRCWRR